MSAENAAPPGLPLCREPWENFYILRRGILPCCYGGAVIGEMEDYAEVWNSPEIQEIRRYLSQGKLAPYCLENPGCPIVQRVLAQGAQATESAPPASSPARGLGASLRRLFPRKTGR
ncbi:MAG: SPASM domain-containing protein [Candidatus Aminicenantes bacterium]|nr:SPASM domain-containing protein [Candidatus Aminicenantes bacterium]